MQSRRGYLRDIDFSEAQAESLSARYSSGDENRYFGWTDPEGDDARSLAAKFLARFGRIAEAGAGWSYAYAGWYQRLLGLAERGWLPVVMSDDPASSLRRINLQDLRPPEWRAEGGKKPSLPLPPPGKSDKELARS